jgi:hypothetical protein
MVLYATNSVTASAFHATQSSANRASTHARAAIRCSQGRGTYAVRAHTSLRHYVEGSKLQLDQSFRLQTFVHGSVYISARSLSLIRANFGLFSLYSACGLYCTHLFKKTPILAHRKGSGLVRHTFALVKLTAEHVFLQISNLTQVKNK